MSGYDHDDPYGPGELPSCGLIICVGLLACAVVIVAGVWGF